MDAKLAYKAKKIRVIFFDIDDTLRVLETGYIPSSVSRVFTQLREKGFIIGIATGRAIFGVVPELRALNPDYFVNLNGAYVMDKKGNPLFENPIEKQDVEAVIAFCKEHGMEYGLVGSHSAALSTRTDDINATIDHVYPDLPIDPTFYEKEPIFQMWLFDESGSDWDLPPKLAEKVRLIRWHPHSFDVVPLNGSKALGVEQVLAHLRLKPEQVMVFGDGLNDIEVFRYAGLSIAMGNGHDLAKAEADYITKTVEEDGILHALEEFGMIEKEKQYPQTAIDQHEGPLATLKTNYGDLRIKLFPEQAPKTVANFIGHAKSGYYDGVIFHRIIKDFMIQGGDPTGTGMGGESIYGGAFEDEFSLEVFNVRGALSMANAGPNTNGSQFFIVQNSHVPHSKKELERGGWPEPIAELYAENGGTPHLDHRHTVFGQLVDEASYTVLDAIASVETGAMDKPVEDVVIETIVIED